MVHEIRLSGMPLAGFLPQNGLKIIILSVKTAGGLDMAEVSSKMADKGRQNCTLKYRINVPPAY